ncbi:hypothetical protein A2954_02240 [Candidatus Roizmanbacteria bacterium RIFCSPLOWO2_01_FULL_37_12]|uniref:MPN domain-containing protein n=1 Tax=Candidatus Roizmanbacteria bacterium RIFCSPLOWO2_01_FULL_37_12 TaxID=1802056 RepID=A0A1F7I898_9BACT|nr:MAG: hypothetical protein A3D76_04810 [Candidatus Roizmanbacteria bacterium RIFCSPHIGHO2_02_FULL_37_9b]OGK39588.1 MAG: hypothetical protein A2954_02240 [Candidatus Roizmanbacteria bacterium RIFCSPLOWO2_01_FULL_37_12]
MIDSFHRKEKPKGIGHRSRLRQRFLQNGLDGFLDYEIIELLLTLGQPRRDCKLIAKQVVKKFENLKDALDSSSEELQKIKGIGPSNIFGLKLFQAISERYAKEKIIKKVKFKSSTNIGSYLQKKIGKDKKEHFVLLSLDTRLQLIKINDISLGTINSTVVHPREVFKTAIDNLAASVIIAHNHPSGDSEPSPEDIALTRRLIDSANILGINMLDHIIVTKDSFVSLKSNNLL